MQIKPTIIYYLTSVRIAIIKKSRNSMSWGGRGEKRPLMHCCWDCKSGQPLWKTVWRLKGKIKVELPYDVAIPPLVLYLKELKSRSWDGVCTPLFMEALFIIAKTGEQCKCAGANTENRFLKCGTVRYYPAFEQKDKPRRLYVSEIGQTQKNTHTTYMTWHTCIHVHTPAYMRHRK